MRILLVVSLALLLGCGTYHIYVAPTIYQERQPDQARTVLDDVMEMTDGAAKETERR